MTWVTGLIYCAEKSARPLALCNRLFTVSRDYRFNLDRSTEDMQFPAAEWVEKWACTAYERFCAKWKWLQFLFKTIIPDSECVFKLLPKNISWTQPRYSEAAIWWLIHTALESIFFSNSGLVKKWKMWTCYRTFPLSFSTTSLAAPVHWKSLSTQPPFFFCAYASNKTLFQRPRHMCIFHSLEYVIYLVWW